MPQGCYEYLNFRFNIGIENPHKVLHLREDMLAIIALVEIRLREPIRKIQ